MKKVLLTAAVSACMAGSAMAATFDGTFGNFSRGDVLGLGTDFGGGVMADITVDPVRGSIAGALIFDTGDVSGGDDDLEGPFTNADDATGGPRPFGNALIVSEDGDVNDPDDIVGGEITFAFKSLVSIDSVFLLDSANETTVSLFLNGSLVDELEIGIDASSSETANNNTPNLFSLLDFGGQVGDTLVVDFSESGAIGEFEAAVVPLPAGLPLLLAGLGGFAALRRRQKS